MFRVEWKSSGWGEVDYCDVSMIEVRREIENDRLELSGRNVWRSEDVPMSPRNERIGSKIVNIMW